MEDIQRSFLLPRFYEQKTLQTYCYSCFIQEIVSILVMFALGVSFLLQLHCCSFSIFFIWYHFFVVFTIGIYIEGFVNYLR